MRDLLFGGKQTDDEFLHSDEGAAANILADRLSKLEAASIVDRRADPADARRSPTGCRPRASPSCRCWWNWSSGLLATKPPNATAPVLRAMGSDREAFIAGVRQRWRSGR